MRTISLALLCLLLGVSCFAGEVTSQSGTVANTALTSGNGTVTTETDGTLTVNGLAMVEQLALSFGATNGNFLVFDSFGNVYCTNKAPASLIPNLPASIITSGTIAAAQITNASFAATLAPTFSGANLTSLPAPSGVVLTNASAGFTNSGNVSLSGSNTLAGVNITANTTMTTSTNSGATGVAGAAIVRGIFTQGSTGQLTSDASGNVLTTGNYSAAGGRLQLGTTSGFTAGVSVFTVAGSATLVTLKNFGDNNAGGLLFGALANATQPGFWVNSQNLILGTTGSSNGTSSLLVTSNITANAGFNSTVSNATVFTLTMPATTVPFTNTNAVSWAYFIDNTAVTGTAVKKNGVQIFSGLSTDVTILLRAGETFSETYTIGTPTLTGNVYP